MGKAVTLLLALFLAAGAAAQESVPVITLDQCIQTALAQGDDNRILQANLDVSRAQHALNVSRDSLSLSGNAGYGQNFPLTPAATILTGKSFGSATSLSTAGAQVGAALTGPLTTANLFTAPWVPASGTAKDATTVGLNLTQILWNGYWGGTQQATVDKSLLTLQGRETAAETGRLSLVYRIKQSYYTMLSAQRTLKLRREILDKQNGVLAQITAVYNLKQASALDLKNAQISARSAAIDVSSSEHDLRLARIRLANLMGQPPDRVFSVAEAEDPGLPVPALEAAVADGLKRRTDLKQIDLNRKSSQIDLALLRGQATPTVSVNGTVNWAFDWTGSNSGTANAGVKISMPILDAGAEKNQEQAIQRQMDAYDVQTSQLQKSIAADIQDAFESAQLQKDRLDLAGLTAESLDLQYQIVKTQYDNGTASNQDLITASVNAANARTALEKAKSDNQLAILLLLNAMGY